eukprot:354441-Chlamydomonas_euryale.AAC.3
MSGLWAKARHACGLGRKSSGHRHSRGHGRAVDTCTQRQVRAVGAETKMQEGGGWEAPARSSAFLEFQRPGPHKTESAGYTQRNSSNSSLCPRCTTQHSNCTECSGQQRSRARFRLAGSGLNDTPHNLKCRRAAASLCIVYCHVKASR